MIRRDEVLLALRQAYDELQYPVTPREVLRLVVPSRGARPSIESVGRYLRSLERVGLACGEALGRQVFWTPVYREKK